MSKSKYENGTAKYQSKVSLVFYHGKQKVGWWGSYKNYDKKHSLSQLVEIMENNIIHGGAQKRDWLVACFYDNRAPFDPITGKQPLLKKILKKDL